MFSAASSQPPKQGEKQAVDLQQSQCSTEDRERSPERLTADQMSGKGVGVTGSGSFWGKSRTDGLRYTPDSGPDSTFFFSLSLIYPPCLADQSVGWEIAWTTYCRLTPHALKCAHTRAEAAATVAGGAAGRAPGRKAPGSPTLRLVPSLLTFCLLPSVWQPWLLVFA